MPLAIHKASASPADEIDTVATCGETTSNHISIPACADHAVPLSVVSVSFQFLVIWTVFAKLERLWMSCPRALIGELKLEAREIRNRSGALRDRDDRQPLVRGFERYGCIIIVTSFLVV
jgi:hypothetical protein